MSTPSATNPLALPEVSQAEFDSVFKSVCRWGQYAEPSRGAWQTVGPEKVREAAALVESGTTVQMALPWNTVSGIDNPNPALHMMVELGDREPPEPSCNKDFLGVAFHGKAVSHLDALSHIAYRGELFDGHPTKDTVNATGTDFGDVAALGHLVTACVLLDFAAVKGVDWIEPGTAFHAEDILEAEEKLGVEIQPGDAVLVRSGHFARRAALGPWNPDVEGSAGLHVDAMPLLAERGIVLLGGDGDSDVRPSPTPGIGSPIHILAITAMGVPLLDNLDLEDISRACAAENKYRFMLTIAPLSVPRGTGSPINPIAVL
ncbi:cyclase family protein [Actinomyces culturomici]|uniref:cyclase family protein n=1 Tax=Actinomyces culturomici TaxID=1926276 RepID=UPI000E1FDCBF|nr:cyclase family protein [Actinomyces culturomici]